MIKTILLAALTMPLLWIACREVLDMVAPSQEVEQEIESATKTLVILQSNTEATLRSASSVRAILFGPDDPDQQKDPSELAKALIDYGNERRKARETVKRKQVQSGGFDSG
jgi:hypothetical protein